MPEHEGTVFLSRQHLQDLLGVDDYIEVVEKAYQALGRGDGFGSGMIHAAAPNGLEFHIKSGGCNLGAGNIYGLKINASAFTAQRGDVNLPMIMGAIILFDADMGLPLAIMDSMIPTIWRTGAGTAVALKYLAADNARTLTICGCGNQGASNLRAASRVLSLEKVFAFDLNPSLAESFSRQLAAETGLDIEPAPDLARAVRQSQVVITCTPSKHAYLLEGMVEPGATIAAVGSDSPHKQELDPTLLARGKVVVDSLQQCREVGELHHALKAGLMKESEVYSEIGSVVAGLKPGRESREEVIVYDATGIALQDTAAAAMCFKAAREKGLGERLSFF